MGCALSVSTSGGVTSVSASSSPPAAQPKTPASSATTAELPPTQVQAMQVQVPPGMQGGMMLQVSTPAGVMQVQIPPGLQGGQMFQIQTTGEPVTSPASATRASALEFPGTSFTSAGPKADKTGPHLLHNGVMENDEDWVHYSIVTGGGLYKLSACYASLDLRPGRLRINGADIEPRVFIEEAGEDWFDHQWRVLGVVDMSPAGPADFAFKSEGFCPHVAAWKLTPTDAAMTLPTAAPPAKWPPDPPSAGPGCLSGPSTPRWPEAASAPKTEVETILDDVASRLGLPAAGTDGIRVFDLHAINTASGMLALLHRQLLLRLGFASATAVAMGKPHEDSAKVDAVLLSAGAPAFLAS
jgi:hypothetical protein